MVAAENVEIRPHPGPQERWLASSADIAIYGGAAGGGKSWALLMEPLRHISNPDFGAVIFRRTYPQITGEGGLWDTATKLYPQFNAKMLDGTLDVKFPAGSRVTFRHMQHEANKRDWQGSQIPLIGFDELTHFTESMFFYMLSRNRSTCGVRPYIRATTNPEAGSWVLELIRWWIDPDTGLPIPERDGIVRWFVRVNSELVWADTREELKERYPDSEPKSLTFVAAKLEDNPTLMREDPGYLANLMALDRVERERLLGGNWLAREDSVFDVVKIPRYQLINNGLAMQVCLAAEIKTIRFADCQHFATIDTAGTSKDKANDNRGKPPSYSACGIFAYYQPIDLLILRRMWRDRVGWIQLKEAIATELKRWNIKRTYIENAHFGPALREELKGFSVEMVGPMIPGMKDGTQGAKLDRAVASGLISRAEHEGFAIPDDSGEDWLRQYIAEISAWGGLPDETADQIDVTSYGSYVAKKSQSSWGGVI